MDCAPWGGNIDPRTGYGRGCENGKRFSAHRKAYADAFGPIPSGMTIDHTCHNADKNCPGGVCAHRRCVNPSHLEAVTSRVNTLRGQTLPGRNLEKTACPQGHPYDEVNTYIRGSRRSCRACHRQRQLDYTARKEAR